MNSDLVELIKLSDVDKSIDSFNPKIEAANKKLANAQDKLNNIQEKIDKTQNIIKNNEDKVIEFDNQLVLLNQQLKDITKKSKSVTTEKEIKALTLEESMAKEKMTFANTEIEKFQDINQIKTEEIVELKESFDKEQENLDTISKEVGKIISDIDNSKMLLYKKREDTTQDIQPNILQFYEKIRMWAENTAVVPMRKQACYGCFMKINDKTYASVIKGTELVGCPHCGRILYMVNEEPEEE